jgi:hypothetical protein
MAHEHSSGESSFFDTKAPIKVDHVKSVLTGKLTSASDPALQLLAHAHR